MGERERSVAETGSKKGRDREERPVAGWRRSENGGGVATRRGGVGGLRRGVARLEGGVSKRGGHEICGE